MRILIVEDDSLFAEILQTFLEDNHCSTVVADNLSAARAQVSASKFDFMLLDNHLPDGDGIDAISMLQECSTDKLPLMMITGEDNQNVMADAFTKGADDFLVKPISLDLLWLKIQRVASLYQKEATLARQAQKLEKMINQREQEEDLARYVYEHVASTSATKVKHIDNYIQSSSSFNGDILISESAPNGNRFVILADATGHGLAAAISILPLVTTLKAMIRKGLSLAHIVHEANSKLCKELPDDKFVALSGVEINFHAKEIIIFNGGMPDIIGIKQDDSVERLPARSMALGILDAEDFDPSLTTLDATLYTNFLLYSDGLIEQTNPYGEEYGMERLLGVVGSYKTAKEPLVGLVVNQFTVFNEMQELDDDLSICDIQIDGLLEDNISRNMLVDSEKSGKVSASISLHGGLIATTDIVGCFDGLMRCTDVIGDVRQRAFTVFAELISNALDHGILDLDSKLKNDYAGFADYLALKEERMGNLKESDCLEMQFSFSPVDSEIVFSIKDSGNGYDMESSSKMQDGSLSGRGLSLISKLCRSVDVTPPGNQTTIEIKREF